MAIEKREVEIAKEIDDVMALVVGTIEHFKSGKGMAEATELLDELMAAINGIDQVDDEFKANMGAAIGTVAMRVGDLVGAMLSKEE